MAEATQSSLIVPLLMAGGAGTRLWPLSRAKSPKQFLALVGGRSTYQQTLARVADRSRFARPVVITNADFEAVAKAQAKQLGIEVDVVLEPARRDSGPAILAGAMVASGGKPVCVLALAADHVILDEDLLLDAVTKAAVVAREGRIVVFGLLPTEPKTAVGYIRPGERLGEAVSTVAEFVEKPDRERAARFIADGMLWNGGNFLFRADVLIEEMRRLAPEIHGPVSEAVAKAERGNGVLRLDPECFAAATRRSIDYAVMEKTDKAAVVASRYRFSDIGSWEAVFEASDADAQGNHLEGAVDAVESEGCYVRSDGAFTAVVGMKDAIVVTTPDAVLVVSRSATQRVKDLVSRIETSRPELVAGAVGGKDQTA